MTPEERLRRKIKRLQRNAGNIAALQLAILLIKEHRDPEAK